jgi:prephenate dehydrogenase
VAAAIDDPRFVGGHPLAGAELAGVAHARGGLFEGAPWYLTPRPGARGDLLARLHRFVAGLGAVPAALDPATHDRVMAAVSHLPHVVANVLLAQAASALGGERMPATGPSFRDATRVAGAHPELWRGIYAANRDALVEQLDGAIARLQAARDELAAGGDLHGAQEQAAAHRRALVETGLAGGLLREVTVSVANRPGVVAELALRLGAEGINIHDMSLSPSADNRTGRVAVWVAEGDAARAAALLAEVAA